MYIVLDTTGNNVLLSKGRSYGIWIKQDPEQITYHHQVSLVTKNIQDKKWQIKR